MGDLSNGWQTVLPNTQSRVERLDKAELEAYERQAVESWSTIDGGWSGTGKHLSDVAEAKKLHNKLKHSFVQDLGVGGQGIVQKFNYNHKNRSVFLARKRLFHRRLGLDVLREEANVLERLSHDHIVRLVGTYSYQQRELYLILWPAATCDLSHLLGDLDSLRFNEGDRADIIDRLGLLELDDISAIGPAHTSTRVVKKGNCPLDYLRQIMGCITHAVAYCHASKIRHLDLKPQNILLSPGRVYLTDFGISRDVHDQDHTRTYLENGSLKWLSPERLFPQDDWSMQSADVYSLGLVFLNIATIMYGEHQSTFFDMLEQRDPRVRLEELDKYLDTLRPLALVTQEVADETASTHGPKHIVSLASRMLSPDPSRRSSAARVNEELIQLGGIQQIYHSTCCKAPARQVTQLLDKKYAQAVEERRRLAEENEKIKKRLNALVGMDETYTKRLENEREKHAKDRANLVKQLEDEQKARKDLEMRLREFEQKPRQVRPGMARHERSISGGLTMKAPRPHRSPTQQHARVATASGIAMAAPVYAQRPVSPTAVRRQETDLRKSTDSLTNYALRSRGSGSRLPQPINPSTPIRSVTPGQGMPRDPNLTDSTTDSFASSMFSRGSRRTTGSGLSPTTTNSSPSASRILLGMDKASDGQAATESGPNGVVKSHISDPATAVATDANRRPSVIESAHDEDFEHASSVHDVASQHGAEKSDASSSLKVPSLPSGKSWAAVAGDRHGLAVMIGAVAGRKKKP